MVSATSSVSPSHSPNLSSNLGKELQRAIEANETKTVLSILETSHLSDKPLPNGELPLHYAIRRGSLDLVRSMLQRSTGELDKLDRQMLSGVDHAFLGQNPKMKTLVLGAKIGKSFEEASLASTKKQGASNQIAQEVETLCSPKLHSPLHAAAFTGDLAKLKALNPNPGELNRSSFPNGFTPLHHAILGGKIEMATRLIQLGARTDLLTADRKSLLHLGAAKGDAKMLQMLFGFGLQIDAVDSKGRTPLHYAMVHENPATAQALILKGADPLHQGSSATPLAILMDQAEKRCSKRDPLKLDPGSMLLFATITGSWLLAASGDHHAAANLRELASLATIPMAIMSNDHWSRWLILPTTYLASTLKRDSAAANIMHGLQTAFVLKTLFKNLRASWKNRSLETYRPLRNVVIHSVNSLHFSNQLIKKLSRGEGQYHQFSFKSDCQRKTGWSRSYFSFTNTEAAAAKQWQSFRDFCDAPTDEQFCQFTAKKDGSLLWQESCGTLPYSGSDENDYNSHWNFEDLFDDLQPKIDPDFCKNKTEAECILSNELKPKIKSHAQMILNLKDGFTEADSKKAFRSLSLKYHPDKCAIKPSDRCTTLFQKINQSYETLNPKAPQSEYSDDSN